MVDYKDLLFDIDNTLLDFKNGSREAFSLTFASRGIDHSDAIYAVYNKINSEIWRQFEAKQIDAVTLRYLRFDKTMEALGIVGHDGQDLNKTYLENLINTTTLYSGTHQLLLDLKPHYRLHVITNGLREVQRARLERLKIEKLFTSITVSDEIGVAKPQTEYFDHVFSNANVELSKENTLVIGDSLSSDIQGGINYGLDTCWVHDGKQNKTSLNPTYSIKNVIQIKEILNF